MVGFVWPGQTSTSGASGYLGSWGASGYWEVGIGRMTLASHMDEYFGKTLD